MFTFLYHYHVSILLDHFFVSHLCVESIQEAMLLCINWCAFKDSQFYDIIDLSELFELYTALLGTATLVDLVLPLSMSRGIIQDRGI